MNQKRKKKERNNLAINQGNRGIFKTLILLLLARSMINILILFKTVTENFSSYQKAAAFVVGGALNGRAAVRFG